MEYTEVMSSKKQEKLHLRLDTLPNEVFLHICSFLSAKVVINVLTQVCRKFKYIVEDDSTWRLRVMKRWPKRFPLVPDDDLDWKEVCIEREEHYDLWKNNSEKMIKYHIKDAHFGCVNVVTLIQDCRLCASGGRDSYLKLWDLSLLTEESTTDLVETCLINSNAAAHDNAWLWDISYDKVNNWIYSAGFDASAQAWDLENPRVPVISHKLSSPVLCLSSGQTLLATGCYGRSASLFDMRLGFVPVVQHIHHKKPVLCISFNDKFLITGSEDKTVVIFDRVAKKVFKTLSFEAYPLSMSHDLGQLLVADLSGLFHVIDPTNDSFELLQSYETGHKSKVSGIQHSLGSVITSSTSSSTIRVLEPNADPETIAVLSCTAEVSGISAYKTTLVSANTDDSITIWKPRAESN